MKLLQSRLWLTSAPVALLIVAVYTLFIDGAYSVRLVGAKTTSDRSSAFTISSAPKQVILYDGVCNFCNSWVDLVLKIDSKKLFTFCALQSDSGKDILQFIGRDRGDLSSVVYVKRLDMSDGWKERIDGSDRDKCVVYMKSDAALYVAEDLGVPSFLVRLVVMLVPRIIRDGIYDIVASNRYRFLGRRQQCRCSDSSDPTRFL